MIDKPANVPICVAWYLKKDYDVIRALMSDGEQMPSFAQWEQDLQQFERSTLKQGLAVLRVPVDPDKFLTWCNARSLVRGARARRRFVNDPANWPAST